MKTFITLSNNKGVDLPKAFQSDDVRYTEALVEHFLKEYTQEGDVVLDPFAGFGTTLVVAEKMKRIPFGVEYEPARGKYIKDQLSHKENLIIGSSLKLATYNLPKVDFCFTSPPYMQKNGLKNPFSGYKEKGSYKQYFSNLAKIYAHIKKLVKKNGHIGIEVSNLKNDGEVTTLAWDVAATVSTVLPFEGEVVVGWEPSYGYGYDHSYVLMFKNDL